MNSISFVMPAYNAEDTIADAIDSIYDTNFNDGDEVIIVNDCSTDKTRDIIIDYQKKFKTIKIIDNKENSGCPATRNRGIESAKNALIFNLDSDDILEKHSVEKLKNYLLKNNADVAAFGEIHFFQKTPRDITHKWICKSGVMTVADYLAGSIIPGGNFIYTKASWEKIGGYWEYGIGLHEFWGFTFKQLINDSKMVVMPHSYYFHRYSHTSLFTRESRRKNESIEVTNKFIEPILDRLSDSSQKYVKENPNWFYFLDSKPLILKNMSVGVKGKVIFNSPVRQIKYMIKEVIKKIISVVL